MKKIYTMIAAIMVAGASFAQTDSTKATTDTIKVGNFIIIKNNKNRDGGKSSDVTVLRKPYKPTKLSTNWFIFDLGFANVNDQTDYASADAKNYLRTIRPQDQPIKKDDLRLKASKSSNVNIWFVMQKLNLTKGYVNLKYGVGLEMFNLRYETNINYSNNPSYIFRDSINFSKNKLYAGYLTVPFMVNINTAPGKKGLSLSAGISAGYLIGSHDKQVSGERGKDKTHGSLGLEQFRLAYVGELGLGPIRLFGSYAVTKLHEKGLEQYPYSFGIRFSNW